MSKRSWTIPVKCSNVKSFALLVDRLNYYLLGIYGIVSSVWLVLYTCNILQYDNSNVITWFYVTGGLIGLVMCIMISLFWLFEDGGLERIISYMPDIKCIED